jgi:uncharacterized protein (TIGR02145 family)
MKNFAKLFISIIILINTLDAQVPTKTGWNLISIPVAVPDGRKTILFPHAVSPAYGYQDGYITKDTLVNGIGYWLKFLTEGDIPLYGEDVYMDSCTVEQGWNIIGSVSLPVPVNTIITEPSEIITSKYFGYTPGIGYEETDTIQPGKGYWVKVNSTGTFRLSNYPPSVPSNPTPADNATEQTRNITLSWVCTDLGGDPVTYDVYFGIDNPPTTRIALNLPTPSLNRTNLMHTTTYYWRVVAKDNHGNLSNGPVWRFTTLFPSCPGLPTITYEGKIYNTVQIWDRCWLKENLDVGIMVNGEDNQNNNGIIEKYCYDDNPSNCNTYGALYQWNEAMQYSTLPGAQGICPAGWHVGSYADFASLNNVVFYDGNELKEIGQGTGAGAGTNRSGFSALLAGRRSTTETSHFNGLGGAAEIWASHGNGDGSYALWLVAGDNRKDLVWIESPFGLSVRCVKD